MKKFLAIFLSFIFIFTFSYSCEAFEIKISGWKLTNEFVQTLIPDATSEDFGRVIYKTYERESTRSILEIILIEGKNSENFYVPELVNDSKKLFPAPEYKILQISGHKAILENQNYLPLVLAIQVNENLILNLESPSLSQKELISIACKIFK